MLAWGLRVLFQQSRSRVARQLKRAKQQTRKLRTYLGRVIRDIERKLPQLKFPFDKTAQPSLAGSLWL